MKVSAEYKKESCVENFKEASLACQAGADQIELCSSLELDGLSPAPSEVRLSLKLGVPIKVMIRARPGNFVYSKDEGEEMLQLIREYQELGASHFVLGMLTHDGAIDVSLLKKCRKIMRLGDTICFHKAIDVSANILDATRQLINSGLVDSILTSGGAPTAIEGVQTIKHMQVLCGSAIEVIAAGKITHQNLPNIHQLLQLKTYHGRKIVSL